MSKVAAYLQEHILGEVSTNPAILSSLSRDLSVLEMTPEMAVYPRATNDIRKIARFTWQLAEKGHAHLPLRAPAGGILVFRRVRIHRQLHRSVRGGRQKAQNLFQEGRARSGASSAD